MKKITIAANWKMYLDEVSSIDFIEKLNAEKELFSNKDIIIFPSHTCIRSVKDRLNIDLKIGMQDCDIHNKGAYTGSTSISSIDIHSCIVGHSERRVIYKENNEIIAEKLGAVLSSKANPILCIGETLEEKNDNITESIIESQLSILPKDLNDRNLTIAYEPVWAIGTGVTATPEQAQEAHLFIRSLLAKNDESVAQKTPILYGGSMNASNASELISCADIDGGLIGGAALKAEDFLQICKVG